MNIKGKINQRDSNGRIHGRSLLVRDNEVILVDGYCHHGSRVGLWKFYYINGVLAFHCYFDNDFQQGEEIEYEY